MKCVVVAEFVIELDDPEMYAGQTPSEAAVGFVENIEELLEGIESIAQERQRRATAS